MPLRKQEPCLLTTPSIITDPSDSGIATRYTLAPLASQSQTSALASSYQPNCFSHEPPELNGSAHPLIDDISSFLEAMHCKNLALKKFAKTQQALIEQLREENRMLRLDNDKKDEAVKSSEAYIATLERQSVGHEGGGVLLRAGTVDRRLESWGSTAAACGGVRHSILVQQVDKEQTPKNVGVSSGDGAAERRLEVCQEKDINRVRQIAGKISDMGSKVGAVYNLFRECQSGEGLEVASSESRGLVGIAALSAW